MSRAHVNRLRIQILTETRSVPLLWQRGSQPMALIANESWQSGSGSHGVTAMGYTTGHPHFIAYSCTMESDYANISMI